MLQTTSNIEIKIRIGVYLELIKAGFLSPALKKNN